MRKLSLCTTMLVSALFLGAVAAHGQEFDQAVKVSGITSSAIIHAGVPDRFDPTSAADSQLAEFGFPMRPDQNDTKAYGNWLKAVSGTRVVPELVPTGRHHLPIQGKVKTGEVDNTSNISSGNWSGYSIVKSSGTPFVEVVGVWIVPSVGNQSKSINGYMSEWVGIDGNCTCNDLIQDGTAHDFLNGKASYFAWVEFIPDGEVELNGFAVAPGDVITAYSWVSEKSGVIYGNYYLHNANTQKTASVSLKIPPKTAFSGKSVEWVVERTQVGGSFNNPLPFYASSYMDDAYYYLNASSHTYTYTSLANEMITMTSTGGSGGTKISKAYEQDGDSMWFEWLAY